MLISSDEDINYRKCIPFNESEYLLERLGV